MRIALTRALVAAFWLTTALYALLSAIPFASKQFLEPQLVPAITAFAVWHQWLSLAVLAVVTAGLAPWLRLRDRSVCAFVGIWALGGLLAFLTPGLSALQPSALATTLSLAALVPPAWLSLLNLRPPVPEVAATAAEPEVVGDFVACAGAAFIISITYAASGTGSGLVELGRVALLHLLVFSAVFALVSVIRGTARFAPRRDIAEAWLARAVVAALLAMFVNRIVLSSLSYTGTPAMLVAAAFGAALAVVLGPRGTHTPGGVEAAVSGLVPRWSVSSPIRAGVWLALAMGTVIAVQAALVGFDWNFTAAKTIALTSWLLVLATALRVVRAWAPHSRTARPMIGMAPFAACVLVLALHQAGWSHASAAAEAGASAPPSVSASSRLIVDALARSAPSQSGLYEYLQSHTNIPRSVQVDPVNVEFAPLTGRSPRRPHVFVFVVDSLRRDYLSPYNDAVSFTPSIARFAAESTVFERAFTRYGATGLSVPSIWVGGLILHKQYVTPFAPMNTLSKLLAANDYRQWITTDHIVETIVPAGAPLEPLDADVPVKDHRFCTTLREVRGRLDTLETSDRPAFVYSLPQDIHISAITREGSTPVDDRDYGAFNPAYASRVRRLDNCFGAFIDDLKARGLYDDSVIVLTADHGDSLGEDGRMGHAYTIFPEIIQVPLLVHLPAALRSAFVADPAALAFTTDVTPSLYALLGETPSSPATIFGRPLFHTASAAPDARETTQVVASSYGSVYGALLDDARRLYIVDAISLREYEYELDGSAAGRAVPVRRADRESAQTAIRSAIDEIARFYAYSPVSSQ